MSVKALGGGASVGSSDGSGGNNIGDVWSIGIDQINKESSDQNEEFSEEEMKQFVSFKEASKMVVNKTGRPNDAKPKIQKVPPMLRFNDKFKKYFEPKVFSFGPYNRPLRTYKMTNQIKVNLAADFLQKNDVKIDDLYRDIKKQIKGLKDCYDDDLTKKYIDKDHKLAWIFMVDGCAILQFMYIFVGPLPETQFRKLEIKTDYKLFLAQDLFLLENQLPYQLLQLIIRHTLKQDELLKSIYQFIFYWFRTPEEWSKNKNEILKDFKHDHVHLLDLLRKKLIQPLHIKKDENRDFKEIIIDCTCFLFEIITRCTCFLFEIIICWTCFLFNKLKCKRNEFDRDRVPVPFRNIGKLREAGINLKLSKTSCVGDISFSGGTLKLPPIIVKESTTRMFLNMLGYEMCPDFNNEFEFSSYMYFMDKLIDRTQDVEELREKNILHNELGNEEEVVKLFNEICTHLFPTLEYHRVKIDIDDYFDKKGLIWLHKVSHDIHQYFKGRWSLVAFIAALLAVFSSIIQTVITALAYQADSKKAPSSMKIRGSPFSTMEISGSVALLLLANCLLSSGDASTDLHS